MLGQVGEPSSLSIAADYPVRGSLDCGIDHLGLLVRNDEVDHDGKGLLALCGFLGKLLGYFLCREFEERVEIDDLGLRLGKKAT